MNTINKSKFLISIALFIIIIFTSGILSATTPPPISPSEHKETIIQFINEINDALDQSTTIAQAPFNYSVYNSRQLQQQIDIIDGNLQTLNERLEDYADLVQGLNEQDRQVRLTFNYLNLVRSNLYTLSSLINARTDIERIQLLDEYFRTRINAANTLAILESLLEKYNT